MRNPRNFFKPMAIGAPDPITEVPFGPSRMIHFFDASNEKMAAKVPDMAQQADILLGFGFTDDIAVLTAAITAVRAHMTPAHRQAAKEALAEG